jgi:hypothetical protein
VAGKHDSCPSLYRESYWRDSVAVVRDVYLPAASTWVWEQDGELKALSA